MKTAAIFSLLLVASLFLMNGCGESTNQSPCNKPNISAGTECCLDQNNNGICDGSYGEIVQSKSVEDNFSNVTGFKHWGHMPITYKIENEALEKQINLTKTAFSKIEEEISGLVSFKEVQEDPDISLYYYITPKYDYDRNYIYAEALITESNDSMNLTIKGEITFYAGGLMCNTGYPALEVHEILHLFKMPHSPLTNSIMGRYAAETSADCKITKIDPEYISCLKYIYSNGELEKYTIFKGEVKGPCYFPNVVYEEESEYGCNNGWYQSVTKGYCCPNPNMKVVNDICVQNIIP
ncbi:MAG: hypothetical protein NTX24_02750 [Candidatus Pacearchaeota archaeon]|nr:hypothetical protein [Candidatus Pacearchaeota archaeon]